MESYPIGTKLVAEINKCPSCGCTKVRSLFRGINSPLEFGCGLHVSAMVRLNPNSISIRFIEKVCGTKEPTETISTKKMREYIKQYGHNKTADLLEVMKKEALMLNKHTEDLEHLVTTYGEELVLDLIKNFNHK